MKKIGVIGAGSWGTALATVVAEKGNKVKIWDIDEKHLKSMEENRENVNYLPGIELNENIEIAYTTKETVEDADVVLFSAPAQFFRGALASALEFIREDAIIINVAKGIEEQTLMTMTEVIADEIKDVSVAVLSGPSHAEEVGRLLPTTCVIGADSVELAEYLQDIFAADFFRVYINPDIKGIELGGSLKNVIALAAGIADGLGYGDNAKAALITRGIHEISRLGEAMDCNVKTFYGLSGIGDLIVTCASMHSRNRRAGILMGQGKTMKEAMDEVHMVVEGVYSARAAKILADKYNVELPIVECVNMILFDNIPAKEAAKTLMDRGSKAEHLDMSW
jgi:glycerol-3-phosphate dehydrogenase (NAD(P)+)